jgi:hypothetical protein
VNQVVNVSQSPAFGQIENVLVNGDLSKLSEPQRLQLYKTICDSVGLNPLTRPFDYIWLQGKLVLYAKKDATDQLRKLHSVSIPRLDKEMIGEQYVVTAYARDKSGKEDSDMGVVCVTGLKGDQLANAMLKAVTKAKRRVTLSICGLGGMPDETEVESIPDNEKLPRITPGTPGPEDGNTERFEYRISFGKYQGRSIEEVYNDPKNGPNGIVNYIQYLEAQAAKTGKPLGAAAQEFIQKAEQFLGAMENGVVTHGGDPR